MNSPLQQLMEEGEPSTVRYCPFCASTDLSEGYLMDLLDDLERPPLDYRYDIDRGQPAMPKHEVRGYSCDICHQEFFVSVEE